MSEKQWVRAAKGQLLVLSAFILLLALAISILALISHSGSHFTVIRDVVPVENPYRTIHGAVLPIGMCLSTVLVLSAVLSTFAVMRESQGLMMMGFLCFVLAFCALLQAAFWRQERGTEVEDAALDIYDSVYENVRSNVSGSWTQDLLSIHQTRKTTNHPSTNHTSCDRTRGYHSCNIKRATQFLCCGKRSPLQRVRSLEEVLCTTEYGADGSQDCLKAMEAFLTRHMWYVSGLLLLTLGFSVYGMALTCFLFFCIRLGITWDRKGKYTLARQ